MHSQTERDVYIKFVSTSVQFTHAWTPEKKRLILTFFSMWIFPYFNFQTDFRLASIEYYRSVWYIYVTNDHGYVPFVANTFCFFSHSWLITRFVIKFTAEGLLYSKSSGGLIYYGGRFTLWHRHVKNHLVINGSKTNCDSAPVQPNACKRYTLIL